MPESQAVRDYVDDVREQFLGGQAREHGYRPALERLMRSFDDVGATNDPKRSAHGNPDMIFWKKSNHDIILGYAEAKDITVGLDKTAESEQLHRYAGYNKLFLTNYLEFRFYKNGEEYERIEIGKLSSGSIIFDENEFTRLKNELQAFLASAPEPIKSGKRLAVIMGQRARRIRDNVVRYLAEENSKNLELEKIYQLMKESLVHDLTEEKFADMYAQTLVYGLFAARYNDSTPDDFTRREASELVPSSNPFLREFFAHIGGIHFDKRLAHIVDELCAVFAVSNVHLLVQKHLRVLEVENDKDPIIHFYEDFLKEYDSEERKRMGAYYTPVPIVRYIVRQVDKILREDFGLSLGLADTSKVTKEIDHGQTLQIRNVRTGRLEKTSIEKREFHRVQVLDPAVGTATFLNETIKFIAQGFKGQEGRWPAYVNDNLLPRLSGFELMMAPYTIAHLKLSMTLQETGAGDLRQRLGVFLTNTLEEGIPRQQDLFSSIGLAAAVTEESQAASEIKHERPIMVVIGNPPYSVSSNNKSEYIEELVKDYKRDLNERNIQPLSDDYIKFIRFAEEMVSKNGEGIVAMITNNSYIDGLIHRQMRKHLLQTFDKIYVLDLHGNSKKKEKAPDGGKDANVFDIQQGVAIIIAVKVSGEHRDGLASLHFAELFGTRPSKFIALGGELQWQVSTPMLPNYYFVPKDDTLADEYLSFLSVRELMPFGDAGVKTHRDGFAIDFDRDTLLKRLTSFVDGTKTAEEFALKDTRDFSVAEARKRLAGVDLSKLIRPIMYRPFDNRYFVNSDAVANRPRHRTMSQLLDYRNIGLVLNRQSTSDEWSLIQIVAGPVGEDDGHSQAIDNRSHLSINGIPIVAPLYIYHDDGSRTSNLNPTQLKKLSANLSDEPLPEDVLDYIYASLHSPSYRKKYKEFLKTDFPRVPVPDSKAEFERLAGLGSRLRGLHLMKSPLLQILNTTFPEPGNCVVEQAKYDGGKVWINGTQYFGNIPESAWNFYIGGYQPAQKWLKDRKGRQLTDDDLEHYQKIIKVLIETQEVMEQIDAK